MYISKFNVQGLKREYNFFIHPSHIHIFKISEYTFFSLTIMRYELGILGPL